MPVTHRFTHGHEIRNNPVTPEPPHVVPRAPESWLHLVRDEEPARRVYLVDGARKESRRVRDDAITGENRIDQQRGQVGSRPLASLQYIHERSSRIWQRPQARAAPTLHKLPARVACHPQATSQR